MDLHLTDRKTLLNIVGFYYQPKRGGIYSTIISVSPNSPNERLVEENARLGGDDAEKESN